MTCASCPVQDDNWSPVSRTSAPCLSNYTLVAHLDSAADMAAVAAITASNVTVSGSGLGVMLRYTGIDFRVN